MRNRKEEMGLQWPPDLVEGNGSQENSLVEGCRKGKWSNPASANHRWLLNHTNTILYCNTDAM